MTTVTIAFDDVFTEVQRLSEYVARSAAKYDAMRIAGEDDEQLTYWYRDGVGKLNVMLDRVIKGKISMDFATCDCTMNLTTSNDSASLIGDVSKRLLANHIIVKWLQVVMPELAPQYAEQEREIEQELMGIAYYREMPY